MTLKDSAFPFRNSGSVSLQTSHSGAAACVFNSTCNSPINGKNLITKGSGAIIGDNTALTLPFLTQKGKFKMAHESFRLRMFQEQYGFEPVGLNNEVGITETYLYNIYLLLFSLNFNIIKFFLK